MSNIKNYTSKVSASQSIAKIEDVLIDLGAKNISKEIKDGKVESLVFLIASSIDEQTYSYKFPVNVSGVFVFLKSQRAGGKTLSGSQVQKLQEQAERTAWKTLLEWVQIQASMIRLQQAELNEIFLPYLYLPDKGFSLWEALNSGDASIEKLEKNIRR